MDHLTLLLTLHHLFCRQSVALSVTALLILASMLSKSISVRWLLPNSITLARALRSFSIAGGSSLPGSEVAAFYSSWLNYTTLKDFAWADKYNPAAAPNRKVCLPVNLLACSLGHIGMYNDWYVIAVSILI